MSDLANDSCKIDGPEPSKKKRTTPTISDLKTIVVADNLDQEACEFFSPLASASPLSLAEGDEQGYKDGYKDGYKYE